MTTPRRSTSPLHRPLRPMTVAGIMSGTSADGIDVAVLGIGPKGIRPKGIRPKQDPLDLNLTLTLKGHAHLPFSPVLRRAVLHAMDAPSIATAELARLNWRLGQAYSEALQETLKQFPCRLHLIGCHGQTVYHQPQGRRYAGRIVACTWQIGEMAMLAAESGVPVVSNFRPADMAAGGQGAPLVPLLDYVVFRHPRKGRVLQNLGGIGNLTALPPGALLDDVLAFDTGPGNMVIDQLVQRLFGRSFDRGGKIAACGAVLDSVVEALLDEAFFRAAPPKTAGREQFGRVYAQRFEKACRRAGATAADTIASATALTARSIARSYAAFVRSRMRRGPVEWVVSGGGARNATLMRMLCQQLEPLGCTVATSDQLGIPAEAKEAAAFALLAYQTWHGRPGNVPKATGAARPAILGEILYV